MGLKSPAKKGQTTSAPVITSSSGFLKINSNKSVPDPPQKTRPRALTHSGRASQVKNRHPNATPAAAATMFKSSLITAFLLQRIEQIRARNIPQNYYRCFVAASHVSAIMG